MAISWIRKMKILYHFSHLSFRSKDGKISPNKAVFDKLSSEELHYLASVHNFDDGPTIVRWIVDSPKCDLGTAIMIFWLAIPDYYFRYQSPPVDKFDLEFWELLQAILLRVKARNFISAKKSFTPDKRDLQVAISKAEGIWELPAVLQSGILDQ